MTDKAASVALTGGAGYSFEDQVAAWFLAHLLCGEMPLETKFGVPTSVDFQVLESGWWLDDLLVTAKNTDGVERRLAISVKRDRQVTQGGFPDEFVEAAWKQWLGVDIPENPFRRERDLLCLAVGQLADTVKSAWNEIVSQGAATTPERMAKRLSREGGSNAIQRSLFESLRCPGSLAEETHVSEVEVSELTSHIRLLHLDFRSPASNNVKTAIRLCRAALLDGSLKEAISLWNDLVAVAADMRPRGGSLDLWGLLRRLNRYSFAEYPDYRGDWRTLEGLTTDTMKAIRTRLGPGITIPRDSLVEEICRRLEESGQEVLLGDSGSGKSALAKLVAASDLYERTVWFNAEHLDGPGLNGVRESLGLDHDLTRLLRSVGGNRALLVLDGLEKFSAPALQNAAGLASALEFGADGSRWHMLMTAQPLRWEMVQVELRKSGFQVSPEAIHQIELPGLEALAPVMQALPSLRQPMIQPQLGRLLCNLKILDWVANAVSASPGEDTGWLGLSDIVETVWTWWTNGDNNQYSRELVLRKTGVEETKSLSGVVVLDQLTTADAEVLADLEERGLLGVKQGRIRFSHDLLGDWARLQTLIPVAESRVPSELRDRAANPRWHTAIRLYGVRILERASDSSAWYDLIAELDDGSDNGQLAGLLVLEAVAVTSNARHLLERTWLHLSKDEGRLLKRLLRRFRHSATFPDPRIADLATDDDLRLHLASSIRMPIWPYWAPMLAFLHDHMDEVKEFAVEPAGELCRLWLSQMPVRTEDGQAFPWRHKAAELALALAREVQALQAERGIAGGAGYESVYEAFLAAAPDLPKQVSALALELAKRRPPSPEIQRRGEESARQRAEERERRLREDPEHRERLRKAHIPSRTFLGKIREPWPAGPTERVDDTFREVCLKKQALLPLMRECPEVAREVILALCIEAPQREHFGADPVRGMGYGTAWTSQSAMFFTGPFLQFLHLNPREAIELIVQLVDFATDRWQDLARAENSVSVDSRAGEPRQVTMWIDDSWQQLIGNSRVFGWYREVLINAPYVVSALMALEKWLYDKAQGGDDTSEWVELILRNAQSLAFIGVLVAVAKKHPHLLAGPLRPVTSIWQVYQWDLEIVHHEVSGVMTSLSLMSWVRMGEQVFEIVKDWHTMPHRQVYFRDLVTQVLLGSEELQIYFDSLREEWRHVRETTLPQSDSLEYLIERFDPANYRFHRNEEGQMVAVLEWPEYLREDSEMALSASSYSLNLIDFPRKCRQTLDDRRQLTTQERESFWEALQYFMEEFEHHGESPWHLDNAIMAGIAVLTIQHQEWLEADDQRAEWCEQQVERIVGAARSSGTLDLPGSAYPLRWQVFLGETAVHLLAMNPSDEAIRFHAAQGVLAYHYDTTAHVLGVAYRIREELGNDFDRLINLGRLWAGIRRGLEWSERSEIDLPEVHEWYDAALTSFMERRLEREPIPLEQIAKQCISLIHETVMSRQSELYESKKPSVLGYMTDGDTPTRYRPGLDWQVIQAVYGWLPALAEASSERERKRWIAIRGELLQLVLGYIHTAPRDDYGEVRDAPFTCEYWVFELVARVVPQLREDEHPERLWQPILDLGPDAHYWVDAFLLRWFSSGSQMASDPLDFAQDWRSMVEYALGSPLWSGSQSTFRLTDLYIRLMGLGSLTPIFDREAYAPAVDLLYPQYERWAGQWLMYSDVAAAFARFIVKPAARVLLLPGLTWLAQAIPEISDYRWNRDNLSEALFSALRVCWDEHRVALEADDEIRQAFFDLLNTLVAREYRGALELRDAVIG